MPGIRQHVYDHWPRYVGIALANAALLLLILMVASQGWWAYALFAAAIWLVLFYFTAVGLLLAQRQGRSPDYAYLFALGEITPTERFVQIEVGRRDAGIYLTTLLTTGKLTIIDLYNPQLTPNPTLRRARQRLLHPPPDPRRTWIAGSVDLIPLPDSSVPAIILHDTLSQFPQHGDRQRLLQEAYRILAPGGRLLLSERTRSLTNWLVLGPAANRLPEPDYWREMLRQAGFHPRQEQPRHDITTCFRADKAATPPEYQLAFKLDL